MKNSIFLFVGCSILSSCSIYNEHFDCEPPCGVPCTSVTDIESMIMETDKGPDVLVVPEKEEESCCMLCKRKKTVSCTSKRKVWMCEGRGHYLTEKTQYIEPEEYFCEE
jgi:conjugal transfer pilus assembly protein TraV